MKQSKRDFIGLGARGIAAIASVVVAIAFFASLGVNRNLEARLDRSKELTILSNDLNRASQQSLEPTIAINEESTVTLALLEESLDTMHALRDMMRDMVEMTEESNDVSLAIAVNTDNLNAKMHLMTELINTMGDETDISNALTDQSNVMLAAMNQLNKLITVEMAALDTKLSQSTSYRILFTFVLPAMP
ncbi:MAG: hypothetical protein ACYC55_09120 [Candidatus Geothermincolia bacterium]